MAQPVGQLEHSNMQLKLNFFFVIDNSLLHVPILGDESSLLKIYLDIAIAKGSTTSIVSTCNMSVEGCRVELSENVDFVDPTVDAVAHGHINQPV